jgi:hypothetical protein
MTKKKTALYEEKKIQIEKEGGKRDQKKLIIISESIILNLESCSSICRNVEIWKLYIIKEFLHVW